MNEIKTIQKKKLKTLFKGMFRGLGLDLKRLSYQENAEYRLQSVLKNIKCDLVFDIGANVGQFAEALRGLDYKGKIVSIEPLSSAHKVLTSKAILDPEWIIHPRSAVSRSSGSTFINVSGNSVSSSLLPMFKTHLISAPDSQYISKEQVDVITLESLYNYYAIENDLAKSCFLKIDAQGNEFEILEGFNAFLDRLSIIYLELSVVKMYQDETSMTVFIDWLINRDFCLWSLSPSFVDENTGRVFQYDGLFVHSRHCL